MTGFGAARTAGESDLSVEIRSVNGKFCDVRVRIPRDLSALEAKIAAAVKARVARGSVDCSIRRGSGAGPERVPVVDRELASRVAAELRAMASELGISEELELEDLLAVDGILRFEEQSLDPAVLEKEILAAVDEALDGLLAMREREGEALRVDLSSRLGRLRTLADEVREKTDGAAEEIHRRLLERLREILDEVPVDPARVAQETALLAERADVSEEITRLHSHLDQMEALLESEEPSGRRMDFLVQEMNREANTIASKATWLPNASLVVEMKAEIERLREQVQNVE